MKQSNQLLKIGERFYFTGDNANAPTFGEIIEILPATNYAPLHYKVRYERERFEGDKKESVIYAMLFNKGIGQRFKTIDQYQSEREQAFKQLESFISSRQNISK